MGCKGILLILILILISIPIILSEDTEISPIVLENIQENEVNVIIETNKPIDTDIELQQLNKNIYSATINEQELQELLQEPNIESIKNDEIFKLLLSDSVPLINASIVHALQSNSINITGRAQTICVIDSGINSTHPGLAGRVIKQKCFCKADATLGRTDCCPGTLAEADDATDNHGHGTHVSGIAAGNGSSIIGVAPKANIVAVKVADSSGNALFSDILLAVQWCTDNSSLYNISIITMSIGGGSFTSACDSNYASLSSEITEAWNKNVTITISSGNSGSTSYITSPACINKSISVSSTTKTDAISSFSNRNSITDLFAPGSSIISTALSGGTETRSGTSMSAPHVAGIIALLQQYKQDIEGKPLTSQEINDTLATNGTLIDDTSGSGRTFIRVDAYKALTAIDNLFPQITYANTTSNINYVYTNITILSNVSDIMLKSVLLESNHTGTLTNYTISLINNQYNYTIANNTFTSGTFQWRVLANDSHGNLNITNWNNLTIYTGAPIITLSSPISGILTNNKSTIINFTATDDLDSTFNCTLYSDSILNQTKNMSNGSVTEFKVNYTDGLHNWNIICNDSHFLTSNSSLRTLTIDSIKPYFISESHPTTELGDNITISFVANDTYLRYVNFSYDGANYSLENTSTTFSKTFTTYQNGSNNFTTYTADYAENINASANTFIVQDTISGPRVVNLIYSSSVGYNSNQYVKMFIVDSRGLSSAKISYNGINYTLSNNTFYNFTYTFTASTCGTNTFKIFTNDTQNNGVTNTTTFSVTGCCGDGTCSSGSETCTSCSTDCGTCTTGSTGGGGGGGGGGFAPTISTITETNETTKEIISYAPETTLDITKEKGTLIAEASPNNPITINVQNTVTTLFITVNENLTNIRVNIEEIETLPESIPIPKATIFKYFEIDLENLTDSSINSANISFRVSKTWINETSLDPNTIKLQRYDTRWKSLKTTLDSEDNEYYYYTSLTPGFSYFAITGEKLKEGLNWLIISLAIVFILIALILFLVHEIKQNED